MSQLLRVLGGGTAKHRIFAAKWLQNFGTGLDGILNFGVNEAKPGGPSICKGEALFTQQGSSFPSASAKMGSSQGWWKLWLSHSQNLIGSS